MDKIQILLIFFMCLQVVISDNVSDTTSSMKSSCNSSESITGLKGVCEKRSILDPLEIIPLSLRDFWSQIAIPISKVSSSPNFCFGDFTGEEVENHPEMKNNFCNTTPLAKSDKFGFIGLSLPLIPCETPLTLNMCVAFDSCGTILLSFNSNLPVCFSQKEKNEIEIISAISSAASTAKDPLFTVSVGLSSERKFSSSQKILYRNSEGQMIIGEIITKGHVVLSTGLNIPFYLDWIKAREINLSKLLEISSQASYMIDYGSADSLVKDILSSILKMNFQSVKNTISSALTEGAEITIAIDGLIAFRLEELTGGIVPDFSLSLFSERVIISTGNGQSGLPAGIYFYLASKSPVGKCIQSIFNQFDEVFKKMDIIIPNINADLFNTEFGLFIDQSSVGFKFSLSEIEIELECMFLYRDEKFSCRINSKYFTVIKNEAEYIFKLANDFFDETGSELLVKSISLFNNAVSATSTEMKSLASTAAEEGMKQILNAKLEVIKAMESIGKVEEEAERLAKQAGTTLIEETEKALKTTKDEAERIANEAAEKVKSEANSVFETIKNFIP